MPHVLPSALLAATLALAACGADGPPTAPAAESGNSLTGQARVGVVGSL
ncbi:hypothetical protein RNZ50_19905 [Paracoccaceae bacterium Fryx2]|nr:hypothetical protein [Paracoccaceae bacterium Fryx2]